MGLITIFAVPEHERSFPSLSGAAGAASSSGSSANLTGPPLGNGVPLRIMPLGASITWGYLSTDGNGYRNDLRLNVTLHSNLVNMVGNQKHGLMKNNANEGWPGYVIDQVRAKANVSVPQWKPNVVLVNAGTNDCIQNRSISAAGARMQNLLETVWNGSANATVLLSSLVINKVNATEWNVLAVNAQYAALAATLQSQGRKLVYVDMHGAEGPQLDDLADNTHPNDVGYAKMADIWFRGLEEASSNGWLVEAENIGIPDDGG